MKLKFIAILTIIIILVVMCVPVFAGMSLPDPPTDVWSYWVVIEKNPGYYYLVCSYNPITMERYGSNILIDGIGKVYPLDKNKGQWVMPQDITIGFYGITAMHKSNHNVVYDDGSGFFFFRDRQSRLFQPTKNLDFGIILRNILAGLTPIVGLLILGISFRKGWAFLQGQLRH